MTGTESVWVISKGSYSDYRVLCACPSEADARALAAKANRGRDSYEPYEVEELPIFGAETERVDVLRIDTEISDDGTDGGGRESHRVEWPFDSLYGTPPVAWRWVRAPIHRDRGGRLEVWGTDHERVRKVVGEKRAQLHSDDVMRSRGEINS